MRILYYIYGLNIGGAETFIYSVLNCIDTNKYQIDLVLQSKENSNRELLDLCVEKKVHIYYIPPFHRFPLQNIKEIETILVRDNYDMIHVHQNAMINICPVIAAIRKDIPIVMHSHNSFSNAGRVGVILHKINRKKYASRVTRLSCGDEAGKWMYGNLDYKIINNAIDLDRYSYSYAFREEIRKKHKLDNNTKVIGHVGRFVPAKNHDFILDIFRVLCKKMNDCVLLLVGDGELFSHINERVQTEGLSDKVILTGNTVDANKYYSAFDVLLFPSIFEGLPFTLVEAQAAGLKCVVSNNVTRSVNVTNSLDYLDVNSSVNEWAKKVKSCLETPRLRSELAEKMRGSVFDINYMIEDLEKVYDEIKGLKQ